MSGGNILLDEGFNLKSKRDGNMINLIGVVQLVPGGPATAIIEIGEPTTFPKEVRIYTPSDDDQGVSIHNGTESIAFFRNDGNVGIGTTNPGELLEIYGSSKNIKISNIAETEAGLIFDDADDPTNQFAKIMFNSATFQENSLNFYVNGSTPAMTMLYNGQVRIGSESITSGTHTNAKLHVDGKIVSKSSFVTVQNWSDYVLHDDYELPSLLNEVEPYIEDNNHLIGVPSESEILENGVNLGEMDAIQIAKIEELTLYTIEQQKQIDELIKEVELLKKQPRCKRKNRK
ncbi:MAG: hypothetical protein IIA88_05740 [Bacteroidetes bacterium]|nr:hypothetical protein [Bacteroidota bacterium]